MNRSTKNWITCGIIAFVVLATCVGVLTIWIVTAATPDLIDEYEIAEGTIHMRVRAVREGTIAMNAPGGIYTYECRADSSAPWQRVTTFRFSDPDKIPRGQVRFLNDGCAYFFHEFVYGVTTDGGRSWTVRGEPKKSFNMMHQWAFPRIESVTLSESGSGVMHVSPYAWQTLAATELRTDDFGKSWK